MALGLALVGVFAGLVARDTPPTSAPRREGRVTVPPKGAPVVSSSPSLRTAPRGLRNATRQQRLVFGRGDGSWDGTVFRGSAGQRVATVICSGLPKVRLAISVKRPGRRSMLLGYPIQGADGLLQTTIDLGRSRDRATVVVSVVEARGTGRPRRRVLAAATVRPDASRG